MSVKRGIYVAPFEGLADPLVLAELARSAEDHGWDGFFVWDHVAYRAPTRAVADPWVALSACATATERLLLGPMVTPLSRRRVQKLARETVTLDQLSRGRLVLGVGLGSDRNGELEPFGEVVDPRARADLLDRGLERLANFWAGEFEPLPVQRPRIPVWVAAQVAEPASGSPGGALGRAVPDRPGRTRGPRRACAATWPACGREPRGRSTSWSRARRARTRAHGPRPERPGAWWASGSSPGRPRSGT